MKKLTPKAIKTSEYNLSKIAYNVFLFINKNRETNKSNIEMKDILKHLKKQKIEASEQDVLNALVEIKQENLRHVEYKKKIGLKAISLYDTDISPSLKKLAK